MADLFEVEKILADRIRGGKSEFKIRWKTFGPKDDSWEPEENLINCPDILKAYKALIAVESDPLIRRSLRTKPTPVPNTKVNRSVKPAKPTAISNTKVTRSVKSVKFTYDSTAEQKLKSRKTELENDFVTPRPPRATIRQRLLELEESENTLKNPLKKSKDEADSYNRKVAQTKSLKNRLEEVSSWFDPDKQSSGTEEEEASWWVVAFCVVCFVIVIGLIVWNGTVIKQVDIPSRTEHDIPEDTFSDN